LVDNGRFLKRGDYGILDLNIKRLGRGVLIFRVKDVPYKGVMDYGNPPITNPIPPGQIVDVDRFGKTFTPEVGSSERVEDIFYFESPENCLLHIIMYVYPKIRVYKRIAVEGIQGGYHPDIVLPYRKYPFAFELPPLEFVVLPRIRVRFSFWNHYGTEDVMPYIYFKYAYYTVEYVKDPDMYVKLFSRGEGQIGKWPFVKIFECYGPIAFEYPLKDRLKVVNNVIPWDASKEEIERIVGGWSK